MSRDKAESLAEVTVSRTARVPDPFRLERYERAPELGPRILFFSGGSALRNTSRVLTEYTHNSIHLITPFDSGGSSAKLRDAFPMIAVGDLRNRLMALADTKLQGHPAVYRLFAHRFDPAADNMDLRRLLVSMARGEHELLDEIPRPLRRLICSHLGFFLHQMPADFDLRGASIGNLILSGGYVNNAGDIDAVIFLFSKLVDAKGVVRPVVDANLHLVAELADGTTILGQHRMTGKEDEPPESPIVELHLSRSLDSDEPAEVTVDERTLDLIGRAELITFPIGSFYTSVIACLLPGGVGSAVARARCPKVYVPNSGADPESIGKSVASAVEALIEQLRADAGPDVPVDQLLNVVVVDSEGACYEGGLDIAAVEALGVQVLDVSLVTEDSAPLLDPTRLVQALLSLV